MDTALKSRKPLSRPGTGAQALPANFKRIGVIGAGAMGNGIAHVVALAGYDVRVNDLAKERYDKALSTIDRNMTRQVSRGRAVAGRTNCPNAFSNSGSASNRSATSP